MRKATRNTGRALLENIGKNPSEPKPYFFSGSRVQGVDVGPILDVVTVRVQLYTVKSQKGHGLLMFVLFPWPIGFIGTGMFSYIYH